MSHLEVRVQHVHRVQVTHGLGDVQRRVQDRVIVEGVGVHKSSLHRGREGSWLRVLVCTKAPCIGGVEGGQLVEGVGVHESSLHRGGGGRAVG